MEQARKGRLYEVVVDPLCQPLNAGEQRGRQVPIGLCPIGHDHEAMIPEEGHPARSLWVRLGKRPDQRVARVAKLLSWGCMKLCDQLTSVLLDAWGDAAAVVLDEVHDEEIGVGVVDMGDGKPRMARKLAKHVGLKLKR